MDIVQLFEKAIELRASDIHLSVMKPPQIRVDGSLIDLEGYYKLDNSTIKELCHQVMSDMHIDLLEKTGEIDFAFSRSRMGRFRINVFKQRGSYGAAFRVIHNVIPTLMELGIPQSVRQLADLKNGLILVTGPTGSGKSTTLASLIDIINSTRSEHILTLEDPIEYLHHHKKSLVNQREVGGDTHSFASGLRSALRQDPDVILVGEMRDLETIQIALTAAETGHLVLSTLHTLGAAKTVDRIIDVFPPNQQEQVRVQLSSVLSAIISQQLLARVDGLGRVGAFEVLYSSPAVRNMIRDQKAHQLESVLQTGASQGMMTMDQSLEKLVRQGRVSKRQALNNAFNPNDLLKLL